MSQTLERALTILDFVGERPRRITEIATFLDVHHSTALRLLHSLRKHGFVSELPDHSYRLGSAVFRLGFHALEAMDLRSIAKPFMSELNDKSGETIHLGTLENKDVVYVEKCDAKYNVRMHSRIGAAAPLYCTGVGKGILAFLPADRRLDLLKSVDLVARTSNTLTSIDAIEQDLAATRKRGYAIDDEENEPDIHCVSGPIFNGANEVLGAISLSAPITRVDRSTLLSFVPDVLEAAQQVSRELGWSVR